MWCSVTTDQKKHIYLHFNNCLQGFSLCWFWSCFVSPVQLLGDTNTMAVIRRHRDGMEGLMVGRSSWAGSLSHCNWWEGMEGWLNWGCGPRRGSGVGWRMMDRRMNRRSDDKCGVVGRTWGSQDGRMEWVVVRWRGRCREWGRWRVTAWGEEIRRGVERGRHMERGRNCYSGRSRKRERDRGASHGGTGFQSPWVDPSIPHSSNFQEFQFLRNLYWSELKPMQRISSKKRYRQNPNKAKLFRLKTRHKLKLNSPAMKSKIRDALLLLPHHQSVCKWRKRTHGVEKRECWCKAMKRVGGKKEVKAKRRS